MQVESDSRFLIELPGGDLERIDLTSAELIAEYERPSGVFDWTEQARLYQLQDGRFVLVAGSSYSAAVSRLTRTEQRGQLLSPSDAKNMLVSDGREVPGEVSEAAEREIEKIPPEYRTRPMSYRDAAKYMRKGSSKDAAEWLSACVKDGSIACESLSRQSHVFDLRDFPADALPRIKPK